MNSVTPMKLIPVSNNETNSNISSKDFPSISTNEMVIKQQKNVGNLTNLDSELLEILHNNDLSDDAKAKLYWIALHKSEVYKDKSMWSEPTIVELRENRFIPIPLTKSVISNEEENVNINRKRKLDESDTEILSNKRKKLNNFPKTIDLNVQPSNIQPSRKRKMLNENEVSDHDLKRMALVNRIENGQISQGEIDREEENIEADTLNQNEHNISESDITSGPLVVVNQQDEPQPSQFKISENLKEKLQPEWLKIFYTKMYSQNFTPFVQSQIKNIIEKIMDKDDKFKITGHSIITSGAKNIKTEPLSLFLSLIHAKSSTTRALDALKNYLNELNIEYQVGSGFKNQILMWVKL